MSFSFTFSCLPLLAANRTTLAGYLKKSIEFRSGYLIQTSTAVLDSSDYTISGWIRFSDINTNNVILSQEVPGVTYRLSLLPEDYYWTRMQLQIGSLTLTPNAYLYYDHWIHFAITRNGNTYSLYVDDGNTYGRASATGISATQPGVTGFKLGSGQSSNSFFGKIACLSVFNYAMTANQVDSLLNAQLDLNQIPSMTGLNPVHEWLMDFNTTSPSTIEDNVGTIDFSVTSGSASIDVPWQEPALLLDPSLSNPSLLWEFDGKSGTNGNIFYIDKISGLKLRNSAPSNTSCVSGPFFGSSGLRLNVGSAGFLTAENSTFLNELTNNDFSIGFYYLPLGTNGASTLPKIISKKDGNTGYEVFRQESPDLIGFGTGLGLSTTNTIFPKPTNGSAWDYWTIVYKKSLNLIKIYRHGTNLVSTTLTGPFSTNVQNLLVGAGFGGIDLENGYIAQIAIWNKTLTEAQIFAAQRLKKQNSFVNCLYKRKRPIASIAIHPTLSRMAAVEPSDDYSSGNQDGFSGRIIWDEFSSCWRSVGQTNRQSLPDTIGINMLFDISGVNPCLLDSNTTVTHSGAGTGADNIVANFGTNAFTSTVTTDLIGTTESMIDVIATSTHVYALGNSGWRSTPTAVIIGVDKTLITSNSIDAGVRTVISTNGRLVAGKFIDNKLVCLLDSSDGNKFIKVFSVGSTVPTTLATHTLFTGVSSAFFTTAFDVFPVVGGYACIVATKSGVSRFNFTNLVTAPTLAWTSSIGESYSVKIKDANSVYIGRKENFVTLDMASGASISDVLLPSNPIFITDIQINPQNNKVYAAGYTYVSSSAEIGGALWSIDALSINSPISQYAGISGLTCHLDSGEDLDSICSVGGKVTQWTDLSGSYNHWIQNIDSSRPSLVTGASGINNLRSVNFNGISSFLNSTITSAELLGSSDYTYFIVASVRTSSGDISFEHRNPPFFVDRALEPAGSSGGYWGTMVRNVSGQLRLVSAIYDGSYRYLDYDFIPANTPILIQVRKEGSVLYMKVGAAAEVSISSGGIGLLTNQVLMGKNHIDTQWLDAKVGSVLFFNRNLTEKERKYVRKSLGTRWGVTY